MTFAPAPTSPDPQNVSEELVPHLPSSDHLSFWKQPHVVNILSFASSLAFHLGLILIGLAIYKARAVITNAQPIEQVIIPDAALIEGAPIGGIPNPGLGADPDRRATQDTVKDLGQADSWNAKRGQSLTASLMEAGGADQPDNTVIVPGVRPGLKTGNLPGNGQGEGGDDTAALFGAGGGGSGQGPRVSFVGVSGNARKVAYIVDASGTMMSIFVNVRLELHKSIDILKPSQSFNIFFFSNGTVAPFNKNALVTANPDNKRAAYSFADNMIATGSTEPLGAIRMAFAQKPELIYILTDGFENAGDLDEIVREFRKLNPDKKVKVNALLIRSAPAPELEKVLRTIVDENGGVYKPISISDF